MGELTENPTVPYEKDEVTRVNLDGLNQPPTSVSRHDHRRAAGVDSGHKLRGRTWYAAAGLTGEVAAAVAKLMSAMDLVYGASKIHHITRCNTTIGQPGVLASATSPTAPPTTPRRS